VWSQEYRKYDNACIMREYNRQEGQRVTKETAYGRIKRMFLHKLAPGTEAQVVVECDWYEEMKHPHPVSKLPQVKLNPHFDACRFELLKNCLPENLVYWKTDPWSEEPDEDQMYSVVRH
jgi:hypothetical protein